MSAPLCVPCADGEHGSYEDERCTCCGASIPSEYDGMTDADMLREIGMSDAADALDEIGGTF